MRADLFVLWMAVLGAGCGARTVLLKDESQRIEEAMRPEVFSERTPGADGIALSGAEPLAEPFPEHSNALRACPPGHPHRGLGSWGVSAVTGPSLSIRYHLPQPAMLR